MSKEVTFKRSMLVIYNALKDGKAHTRAALEAVFAKAKIKPARKATGVARRLGRIGRAGESVLGKFDVVLNHNKDDFQKTTFQLVKGAQAKKSIEAKEERYGSLAEARKANSRKSKSKKSAKKVVAKKSTKKATHHSKPAKKSAHKTTHKKVAVPVGGGSGSEDNEALGSDE